MIKPNGCFPPFPGRNPLDELDLPIEIGKRVLFNRKCQVFLGNSFDCR